MTQSNKNLHKANKAKNDEFYTQLSDIHNELNYYEKHLKNKTIFCNCDDPLISNFFQYFSYDFERLKLKKLITTCYSNTGEATYLEYTGDKNGNKVPDIEEIGIKKLKGNGDFRSEESITLLKEADIVISNPPFSLFREYVAQLIEYKKKFLIIGNQNAITYKETFKLIKDNKIWLGHKSNIVMDFKVPDNYSSKNGYVKVPAISWFTNLSHNKRNEDLILYKKYNKEEYPKYDNYDAINVDKVKDIPVDYNGIMGVPITFLGKHNPEQFEIIGYHNGGNKNFTINKKYKYGRIHIKKNLINLKLKLKLKL